MNGMMNYFMEYYMKNGLRKIKLTKRNKIYRNRYGYKF